MRKTLACIACLLTFCHVLAAAEASCSGTLPVIFVTTADTIDSKYDYVDATFYIDPMGQEGIDPVGSAENPLPLLIRGRGNWTWFGSFQKKSYKIKLDSGMPLFGMGKNKHFALLAHADGNVPFFRNTAGFELSRMLNLDFTPAQQPVELVLNGRYEGLYFVTETVRVGKHRVNITEQADYETDQEMMTGGWLLEIDNADDQHQLKVNVSGTNLEYWWITYHSPENLSVEQRNYLRYQLTRILATVYKTEKTKTAWPSVLDMESLVRFYMLHEMLDNVEAFLGSCYFFRDRGEERWRFGPVWDCGTAFNSWHAKNSFIYQYSNGWQRGIMEEIALFPAFQERLRQLWHTEARRLYDGLQDHLASFAAQIKAAAAQDYARWPAYGCADADRELSRVMSIVREKETFLVSQWGEYEGYSAVVPVMAMTEGRAADIIYNLKGQPVDSPQRGSIYIRNGKKFVFY